MTDQEKQGCLARLFGFLKFNKSTPQQLPYRTTDSILTPNEQSFFHTLHSITQDKFVICPKVRLADILFIADRQNYMSYFGRISQKHIDFVLCHPNTLKPLLAIEIDDSSHRRSSKRAERDAFVNRALDAAQLPLVRINATAGYDVQSVKQVIREGLARPQQPARPTDKPEDTVPLCPKCGIPMVKRVASRGSNAGNEFWGCENYPQCKEIIGI